MGRCLHFGQTELESISMITIRKATTRDCDVILQWENNPLLWEVTDEPGPFTKEDILFMNFVLSDPDVFDFFN